MLAPLLSLTLVLAPPGAESARTDEPAATSGPDGSASAGGGALAPVPNYDEVDDPAEPEFGELAPAPEPDAKKPPPVRFEEPEDFGPFYEPEPASEVVFPGDAVRPDRSKPFASVAGGMFCFVEDSACGSALIADADVGVGLNVINSDRGLDVPYTQFRVRGGIMLRPIRLAKKRWHAWGIGPVVSWSLGSSSIIATTQDATEAAVDVVETDPLETWRIALANQIWLSQKRNALHLDFTLGGANSTVLNAQGRYWGTHAEVALGFGGWGGLYIAGDFLDQDMRVFMGLRGHGIATAPLIALIVLGLVAGGVSL